MERQDRRAVAHADKLTAEAKIEAKPHLDGLRAKLEEAKAKLHEMAQVTDDKWDDVKKGAEHVWSDVKGSVEGAYDAIKPSKKES